MTRPWNNLVYRADTDDLSRRAGDLWNDAAAQELPYGFATWLVRSTEPELRKRFDAARRKRLGLNGEKIRLLPTSK
jgi:hypothetical protein